MTQTIGVYSGEPALLDSLRASCPSVAFLSAKEGCEKCRITIVDADSLYLLDEPVRKSIVRIVLARPGGRERRQGDLYLDRDSFIRSPAEFLTFATDMADTSVHASELELEIGYLTGIHELMTMVDAEAVSERITRTVLNLIGVGRGTLFLHDPRLERYVVSFTNDPTYKESGEFLPGIPPALLQAALSSPEQIAVGEEVIVMPLQVEQDLVGVIKVPLLGGEIIDPQVISAVHRYLLTVTQVLGNIYQLTRSRDLAMRDDLTKAFNRRFFETCLDEEIERARRYGAVFSIIFLDLDDLKMVNNFYGHLTGSRVLQEVAKRILGAVRGIDKVVRFGGDEFCIILPQTAQDQAMAVANRVRKALTASAYLLDAGIELSITASFGISSYPIHALTKDGLIRAADAAMYRVKSTTKNAVGVAVVEDATKPAVH